jgi:serine/threonine protein kinase
MQQFVPAEGFPEVRYLWTHKMYNALVMEVLGESLDHLHKKASRRFSIATVIKIAIQVLTRIEVMHNKGYVCILFLKFRSSSSHVPFSFQIHRDLKPENFVVGHGDKNDLIYLIDFGLSKAYVDPNTRKHIAFSDRHGLVGTFRYISLVCSSPLCPLIIPYLFPSHTGLISVP